MVPVRSMEMHLSCPQQQEPEWRATPDTPSELHPCWLWGLPSHQRFPANGRDSQQVNNDKTQKTSDKPLRLEHSPAVLQNAPRAWVLTKVLPPPSLVSFTVTQGQTDTTGWLIPQRPQAPSPSTSSSILLGICVSEDTPNTSSPRSDPRRGRRGLGTGSPTTIPVGGGGTDGLWLMLLKISPMVPWEVSQERGMLWHF